MQTERRAWLELLLSLEVIGLLTLCLPLQNPVYAYVAVALTATKGGLVGVVQYGRGRIRATLLGCAVGALAVWAESLLPQELRAVAPLLLYPFGTGALFALGRRMGFGALSALPCVFFLIVAVTLDRASVIPHVLSRVGETALGVAVSCLVSYGLERMERWGWYGKQKSRGA